MEGHSTESETEHVWSQGRGCVPPHLPYITQYGATADGRYPQELLALHGSYRACGTVHAIVLPDVPTVRPPSRDIFAGVGSRWGCFRNADGCPASFDMPRKQTEYPSDWASHGWRTEGNNFALYPSKKGNTYMDGYEGKAGWAPRW